MIFAVALAVCIAPAFLVMHGGTTPLRSTMSAFMPHAPVEIDSNAEFHATAALEGWPGSGTLASPYIISGYEFAGPENAYAFYVGNSTVYFVLRNCYFHDSTGGAYVMMSTNGVIEKNLVENCGVGIVVSFEGTIENNTVESCSVGILFSGSGKVESNTVISCNMGMMISGAGTTVANNSISDCTYAVMDYSSLGNTYSGNNMSANLLGILLSSSGNVISGNTFWKNLYAGLLISDTYLNTLRDNVFVEDGIVLSGSSVETWNSHDIDTSNTVNGDPVLYLANDTGSTVTAHYGQVILANCTGTTIDSQDIDNTSMPIQVGFCSGVTVMNSVLRDSLAGMTVASSNNVTLSSTSCVNVLFGIDFQDSEFCTVSGNTFQSITDVSEVFGDWGSVFGPMSSAGIVLSYATDCSISNNIFYSGDVAVTLSYSLRTLMTDNKMSTCGIFIEGEYVEYWNTHDIDNTNSVNSLPVVYLKDLIGAPVPTGAGQVILANCSQMQVTGSNIDRATAAFELGFTSGCRITGISASNCQFGVRLYQSPGIQVDNSILTADDYGVCVEESSLSTVETNQIVDCASSAIQILGSQDATLQSNTMTNCGIVIDAQIGGVYGWNTHSIDNSNIVNGKPVYYEKDMSGLTISGSYGQVILANCASSVVGPQNIVNASIALQLGYCTDITVNKLNASKNNYAVMMTDSSNCALKGPWITNNTYGVYMDYCYYNTVTDGLFYMNEFYAVHLTMNEYSLVTANVFKYNNGAGDVYDPKHVQAFDDDFLGTNSWNGSLGGNYWQDWLTPDENGDGIVDVPYKLDGGYYFFFASGAAKDYQPLTGGLVIPEFITIVPVVGTVALIVLLSGIAGSRRRRRD